MTTEMVLDPIQIEAIEKCTDIKNRVVAVTGAAGSGKTTILKQVYYTLIDAGYSVVLASPTGKAAKRIYEATGINALTIHRLLEYNHPGDPDPKTGKPMGMSLPQRTRATPLDWDIVLVDEYAMVNDDLHRNLFDALKVGGAVRVFGDDNQLAPIEENKNKQGEPSPFLKLLNDRNIPSVVLKTVFRQGQDSGILLNATQILKSRTPTNNEQWKNIITDQPVKVLRELVEEGAFADEDEKIDYSQIDNQIICLQNKSWVGTVKLNRMLQGLFHNEMDPHLDVPRHTWVVGDDDERGGTMPLFIGDKVIYTRNNYDLGVYNGETGKVIELDYDTGEVVIDFGDREQSIPPLQIVTTSSGRDAHVDPRKDIDLAYAITTHKSQGSEFKRVIYVMNKSTFYMTNRRNFYTAITRAREHVTWITDQMSMKNALYKKG